MNIFEKIRNFCGPFRIVIGLVILITGYLLGDGSLDLGWWYLGLIPLIAGLTDFCPACIISGKCRPRGEEK